MLLGRFVAILRALMPAVAGTTRMPYRTFLIYNVLGGLIWGVGYCLLGYAAGSAYAAIERTVGTGWRSCWRWWCSAGWGSGRSGGTAGSGPTRPSGTPSSRTPPRRMWSPGRPGTPRLNGVSRAFVRRCGPGPVGPGY